MFKEMGRSHLTLIKMRDRLNRGGGWRARIGVNTLEIALETLGAQFSLGYGSFDTCSNKFCVVSNPASDLLSRFGEVCR